MWVSNVAHQHKLLHVLGRRLRTAVSVSRVGSQVASYHFTATLLNSEDSSLKPAVRRRLRGSNSSSVQHKTAGSGGWPDGERKPLKNEIPPMQKWNQRRGDDSRVSSELRKLSLEDYPAERESLGRQNSRLDSKGEKSEVIFGVAPCLLALTQGRRKSRKLFVKDGQASHRVSVLKVCEEAHRRGVQVQRISKKELDKMSSGGVHQGVCLHASPLTYLTDKSAPNRGDGGAPLWLVLDRIQDPMNLGAILRSAYFLGVDRVVSSLRHSCPLSPVVSKASSGVMEVIGVYGYENLEDVLKAKVAQGWQAVGTVGAEAEGSQIPVIRCSDFKMTKPTLLLMGGEGEGLSPGLLSLCKMLLTIPAGGELFPGIESLNVSVATGILLYSLLSSRKSAR
ncbi:rRNA methyltransferase 1, mitochondrial [Brachyistius frenatus]|uniref:rRNA methyltransferase 1, mitochondrial n=1 Tax=Brachyistius frenatus TaxID=100188 RepID=UPI0037E8B592